MKKDKNNEIENIMSKIEGLQEDVRNLNREVIYISTINMINDIFDNISQYSTNHFDIKFRIVYNDVNIMDEYVYNFNSNDNIILVKKNIVNIITDKDNSYGLCLIIDEKLIKSTCSLSNFKDYILNDFDKDIKAIYYDKFINGDIY